MNAFLYIYIFQNSLFFDDVVFVCFCDFFEICEFDEKIDDIFAKKSKSNYSNKNVFFVKNKFLAFFE